MKFIPTFFAILFTCVNLVFAWRLKGSENLAYKDLISPSIDFNDMRFKEQLQAKGPWNNLLNNISNTAKGIQNKASEMKDKAIETVQGIQDKANDMKDQAMNSVQNTANDLKNKAISTVEGLKKKANDMKMKAISAAQNLASDINCLLGKCKDKKQQDKLDFESKSVLSTRNFESKKYIDDPYIQMQFKKNSDEEVEMGENGGSTITIKKKVIQDQIDPRFIILRPYDGIINADNSVRFYAMDTTTKESLIMKLYFKGDPKLGKFYTEGEDPSFRDAVEDCKDSKLITNRLFNKTTTNTEAIVEGQDNTINANFEMTRCLAGAGSSGAKTAYYSIFTIPVGEKLSTKCLHDMDLNKDNSCVHYLKLISAGLLNGIKMLNSGKSFYKHGNIRPHNVYLYIKNDTQKIFLDNMIYDKNVYDDLNEKPFKYDFNMLGETLLQLLSGTSKTENVILQMPDSTFQIYYQIRRYFLKHSIDVNLKIAALNIEGGILDYLGKCVTRAEYEYKLKKSIFNFIFRLKCSGTNPADQFMDIDQALNHEFIKSANGLGDRKNAESWDINPADY